MYREFIEKLKLEKVYRNFKERTCSERYFKSCPICNGRWEDVLRDIRVCKKCGTQYKISEAIEESIPDIGYIKDLNKMMAGIIDKYLSRKSRVLEIGCAYGDLLQSLYGRGHITVGLDIVDLKRREYKFDVLKKSVESVDFPNARLDAVIMVHVIEHLRNPAECLIRIRPWLKEGGKIFIFTNEADNFPIGCIIDLLQQDTHRQLITEKGFKYLAEKIGYKIKEFIHRWDYQIFTILEKR